MILLIITLTLFALYCGLILFFARGWTLLPFFTGTNKNKLQLSIIIPARNEENRIGLLLEALRRQTYDAAFFEIIVVDDHSTDNTAAVVNEYPEVRLIQLNNIVTNSYKKKAIETGIAAAKGEWIVTTDADCVPPKDWLNEINSFAADEEIVFIAAPVSFSHDKSILEIFQAMDFQILQGITGAAAHQKSVAMCNGANLAFKKDVFYEVNGYKDVDQLASGDDMFLMQKILAKYPEGAGFLKSRKAIVATEPMHTWRSFIQQRIRWASKANHYKDKSLLPVLLLVYLFNLNFLVLLIAGLWNVQYVYLVLILWLAKTLVELFLLIPVSKFFNKQQLIPYFFILQPLHILYTIAAGLLGQFGSYEWKGRRVR